MSYKLTCDLCGKPIESDCRAFKVKELKHSMYEIWWEKIDAHAECVKAVIDSVRKKKGGESE